MEIIKTRYKRCDLLNVKGRVDSETAGLLGEALDSIMGEGVFRVVVDMSNVTFVSSKGWWVLITAQKACKRHKGEVVMVNLDPRIRKSLETVGMGAFFRIFDEPAEAVGTI